MIAIVSDSRVATQSYLLMGLFNCLICICVPEWVMYTMCVRQPPEAKSGIGSSATAVGGCYKLPGDANQTRVLFSTEPSPLAADMWLLPRWHLSSFCKTHLSVRRDCGFSSPSLCILRWHEAEIWFFKGYLFNFQYYRNTSRFQSRKPFCPGEARYHWGKLLPCSHD